mmetsp:Transcript_63259/g.119733  ORF Transcript_63259/g.119733 Transcript_63259/m.119733 type:complete len:407 (+) Transcript_63259:100-1320(+)
MAGAAVLRLGACFLALPVVPFDIDAHDAIGQTSASAMDQTAIKQVKRLLGGQDASDVAGWGHQVDDTYPGMERLHFQIYDDGSQPFCGPAEGRVPKCEDNICLLTAIKHFYGRILSDEGRKTEYPQIDYNKAAKGVKFTDADAVKMLINLLGDLHQPLHLAFSSINSGKDVKVKFKGKEMSLYDVWDKGISEVVRNEESSFWLGGWTHVSRIRAEFDSDKEKWKQDGAFKTFERWAAETVSFACDTAYKHPTTGKMLVGPNAGAGPVELDEAAYQAWKEKWLRQILLAGERTAVVLNDILDSSGAAKLSQGSKVHTKADEEAEKQKAEIAKERKTLAAASAVRSPRFNFSALFTNFCIACIVVPLFLLFAQSGLSPSACKALLASLADGGGSNGGSHKSGPGKRWE